jgi:hypothetical protein
VRADAVPRPIQQEKEKTQEIEVRRGTAKKKNAQRTGELLQK